jgi:hypothetical protein
MARAPRTKEKDMARSSAKSQVSDPKKTLRAASTWLICFGMALTIAGAISVMAVLTETRDSTQLWRASRALAAALGWLVPGALYLLFGFALPRRKRWAITGAEVISYIQLLFAGVLVVVALLNVKALWPLLLIGIAWVVPLVLTPRIVAPCQKAITMLVQVVTLDAHGPGLRESRRPR